MKKLRTFQIKFTKRAFSLIELAIVGLIISLLMAGIMGSSVLKKRATLANARTITNNSPVAAIGDLALWYETTSEKSFSADEAVDGSSVSTWYDINPNIETVRNNATQTTAGNRPTYKTNKINELPAISFTRANSNFLAFDGTSLANSNYTIFVVEQRTSNDTSNTFIGGTSATTNSNLSFSYQNESIVIDQYDNGLTNTIFPTYNAPTPRIHTFSFNFSTKKYYVNGIEFLLNGTGASYNIAQSLAAFPGAALGANRISGLEKYFQGDIGEVIIFKKSLNIEDRKSVEKYLGKKWSITVSSSSSACNGIITNNGCETSCIVSIAGVTSPSSVAGPSSGTFTCSTPEYNDTIPYTCSSTGVLDISGQSCDVCNTGSNYSFYNGICQGQCTPGAITGVASSSPVNAGAATITCNDTANHFAGSVTGICDNGTFTLDVGQACGCASGYGLQSGVCVRLPATCTGNTPVHDTVNHRYIHTITSNLTLDCSNVTTTDFDILLVGGGGGGGCGVGGIGGGGGGGQVLQANNNSVTNNIFTVIIGNGGFDNGTYGGKGGNSSIVGGSLNKIAMGGGNGLSGKNFEQKVPSVIANCTSSANTPNYGSAPGGGGFARNGTGCVASGGRGTRAGGMSFHSSPTVSGGGSSTSSTAAYATPYGPASGAGGVSSSISGQSRTYGGGGGGSGGTGNGSGGAGGGGAGGGGNGTNGLGGGGGGIGGNANGGTGGSGVIIISYPDNL